MKHIFILLLAIISSCNIQNTNIEESNESNLVKQDTNEIHSIIKTLTEQQLCWNNGDIDGFMQGYWQSEKLIFTSLKHKPAYGWENTLKRYKESYPDRDSMGELRFEILDLNLTSKITARLFGKWELIRMQDHPQGFFWVDLKKFDTNWLITKDSTISLDMPTPL